MVCRRAEPRLPSLGRNGQDRPTRYPGRWHCRRSCHATGVARLAPLPEARHRCTIVRTAGATVSGRTIDRSAALAPPGRRPRRRISKSEVHRGTWIPQLDDDGLGWTDLRSEIVFGLPFFTRETPILITPSYELHFLDRPEGVDLPPRLHDLVIDFNHFRRVTNNWIANIASVARLSMPTITASIRMMHCRINGRAVAIYDPTPEWKGVLGVTYVNGGWAKIVPIAGVVYEPNDDVKYELVFPRPRVAWRLPNSPVPGRDEFWFYVLGRIRRTRSGRSSRTTARRIRSPRAIGVS